MNQSLNSACYSVSGHRLRRQYCRNFGTHTTPHESRSDPRISRSHHQVAPDHGQLHGRTARQRGSDRWTVGTDEIRPQALRRPPRSLACSEANSLSFPGSKPFTTQARRPPREKPLSFLGDLRAAVLNCVSCCRPRFFSVSVRAAEIG